MDENVYIIKTEEHKTIMLGEPCTEIYVIHSDTKPIKLKELDEL